MKFKIVIFLFMGIFNFWLIAAEDPSVTIAVPETGDVDYADFKPSVDLKLVPSDSFSYVLGFSGSETSINPQAEFDLSRNVSASGVEFAKTSRVYVYWDIFGTQSFELQLQANGPLKSISGYIIPWEISWTDKNNVSANGTAHTLEENDYGPEVVMVYTKPSTGFPVYEDTVQLTISPAGEGEIAAEVYTATLTLSVIIK